MSRGSWSTDQPRPDADPLQGYSPRRTRGYGVVFFPAMNGEFVVRPVLVGLCSVIAGLALAGCPELVVLPDCDGEDGLSRQPAPSASTRPASMRVRPRPEPGRPTARRTPTYATEPVAQSSAPAAWICFPSRTPRAHSTQRDPAGRAPAAPRFRSASCLPAVRSTRAMR